MNETLLVHEVNTAANLDEEVEGSVLTEVLLFPDQVEQVAFGCVLQGQVDALFVLKARVEAADVLMV